MVIIEKTKFSCRIKTPQISFWLVKKTSQAEGLEISFKVEENHPWQINLPGEYEIGGVLIKGYINYYNKDLIPYYILEAEKIKIGIFHKLKESDFLEEAKNDWEVIDVLLGYQLEKEPLRLITKELKPTTVIITGSESFPLEKEKFKRQTKVNLRKKFLKEEYILL